jgi:DeoR family transcriptional regulator, fructose operon transcriptional repressor
MTEQDIAIPYVRRKHILDLVTENEIITLEELQKHLIMVSMSTIRRDVLYLQKQNLVQMLRGGAVKLDTKEEVEQPLTEKLQINLSAKARIAQYAAKLVHEGDTIYIDSGTTAAFMVDYLADRNITIVTSSLQVIADANKMKANILILGGEINKTIGSVSGPITDRQLEDIYFDKAFIGASGFSTISGINTFDIREASKKRIVQKNSKVTYVLVDSSKAGKNAMCRAFGLADCIVITDESNAITNQVNALIVE